MNFYLTVLGYRVGDSTVVMDVAVCKVCGNQAGGIDEFDARVQGVRHFNQEHK